MLRSFNAKTLIYWLATTGIVLVLALLFWLLSGSNEESGADRRAKVVASFLAADTQVLLHCPSVPESILAFKGSHFGSIWENPDVARFMAGPFQSVSDLQAVRSYWDRYTHVQAEELILALGYEGVEPVVLAGFHSPLSDQELWEALHPCREWLETNFRGEWDHDRFDGAKRASFSTIDFELTEVRYEDWYFVTNNRKRLDQVIARLQGKKAGPVLAEEENFIHTLERLPRDYLTLAYVNIEEHPPRNAPPLPSLSSIPAIAPLQRATAQVSQKELRSMAMTASIRGGRMVDHARFVTDEAQTQFTLTEDTLAYANDSTLCYLGAAIGLDEVSNQIFGRYADLWFNDAALKNQFFESFGREWALIIDPVVVENGNDPGVSLTLAFQMDRPDAFTTIAKELVERTGSGLRRQRLDIFRLNPERLPHPFSQLFDELYLSVSRGFLLVSTDLRALETAQTRSGDPSALIDRPQFRTLKRQLPTPDLALGFIDNKRLLHSAYEAVQHPLVLGAVWMALRSQTNLVLDFNQLPPAESLVGNLTPTMVVVSRTPTGYQQASIGSISPSQWLAGGSLLAALMDQTFFKPLPEDDDTPFLQPIESDAERLLLESQILREK